MGLVYAKGLGKDKSKRTAREWFRKAAYQGHKKAAEELRHANHFRDMILGRGCVGLILIAIVLVLALLS